MIASIGFVSVVVHFLQPYKDTIIQKNIDAYRKEFSAEKTSVATENNNYLKKTKKIYEEFKFALKHSVKPQQVVEEIDIESQAAPPINTNINVKNTTPATPGRDELHANAQKSSRGVPDKRPLNTTFDKQDVPPKFNQKIAAPTTTFVPATTQPTPISTQANSTENYANLIERNKGIIDSYLHVKVTKIQQELHINENTQVSLDLEIDNRGNVKALVNSVPKIANFENAIFNAIKLSSFDAGDFYHFKAKYRFHVLKPD